MHTEKIISVHPNNVTKFEQSIASVEPEEVTPVEPIQPAKKRASVKRVRSNGAKSTE